MDELVVIGMGHIGGSVAAGASARSLFPRIVGVESNAANRARARERRLADEVLDAVDSGVSPRLVVVAVPPAATADIVVKALAAHPNAIVTDVAGVKAPVVDAVRAGASAADAARYVGSHPMAGTANSGPDAADPALFDGRPVVVAVDDTTAPRAIAVVEALWRGLGASIVRETPAAHDRAIAAVSHLPHVIAFALVRAAAGIASAPAMPTDAAFARISRMAGPSFEGATRVAASDPALWTDLLLSNRAALIEALAAFRSAVRDLETAISAGDGKVLRERLEVARNLKTGVRP